MIAPESQSTEETHGTSMTDYPKGVNSSTKPTAESETIA